MLYISKEGEIIRAGENLNNALELYDSWNGGTQVFTQKTSGSTGRPKNISIPREAILNSISQTQKAFDLSSEDYFLCNLNADYIGGKMMIFRAAELKCDLMVVEPTSNPFESIQKFKHFFSQNWGKNFFSFVPLQLKTLLEKEENIQLLRTAKAILVGGAAVDNSLRDLIKRYELPVFETYGMTETVSHIALKDLRTNDECFTTLEGVNIKQNKAGCLKIQSPSTLNKWVETNDIVEILSDKTFILKGRKDNIINSGGVKIQLEEVERLIKEQNPEMGDFFCYGVKDKTLGQKLVLVTENELVNPVFNLPKYHTPKAVLYIDKILRTPSGKIDKRKTIKKLL